MVFLLDITNLTAVLILNLLPYVFLHDSQTNTTLLLQRNQLLSGRHIIHKLNHKRT